ncbi:MAG: hypothetical protein AMXMBFR7_03510 [Planctomycetota bacterium]
MECEMADLKTPDPSLDSVLTQVERALRDLRFGSVELIVHDGRVVQIERKEKVRLGERGEDLRRPG